MATRGPIMTLEPDRVPAGGDDSRWLLVDQARSADSDQRRAALQGLLVKSIPSLRLYLTYQLRLDSAAADDLLQEFVLEKMLSNQLLWGADRQRGRFRSLLQTALRNFVLDRMRRSNADKRLADRACRLSDEMVEALADNSPRHTDLPDVAHAWQVLIETLHKLRAECLAESRSDLWSMFEDRVLKPAAVGGPRAGLDELAKRFGYASKIEVSNALVTVQRKLNRALRQVMSQHVPAGEVDAELDELQRILAASDVWQPALATLGDWQPASVELSARLPRYSAAQLSESLRFGSSDDPAFAPELLAETLRELLNTPRHQLWNREHGPDAPEISANEEASTLGQLLADPAPSLGDLVSVKEFFKCEAGRSNRAVPQAICTLLYYAAIVVAGIRLQQQISSLGTEALLHGIDWLDQQSWLDAKTRKLLADGRKWLDNLDESSAGNAAIFSER
jgi:DNA-directed RNA polymerase specialized sigma24 family protein